MEQRYSLSRQAQERIKDEIAARSNRNTQSQDEFKQQICWEATELILKQKSPSYRNGKGLRYTEVQLLIRNGILAKFEGYSEEIRQEFLAQIQDGNPESVLSAIYGSEWEKQKYLWRKLD